MKRNLMVGAALMMFAGAPALAGGPLSGEQIKQLAIGNTIAIYSVAKNRNSKTHYAPEGVATSYNEDTGKTYKGTWRITDSGEWCNYWPTEKNATEHCGQVIDNGDGTYNRLEEGSLRSVWKKIYPGNAITE
jgi:hypothetical protein